MKIVLIVDDEALARTRIARYLQTHHAGVTIIEAQDGVEALEAIARQRPDVMFLDIEMPELDGFATLRQIPERDFPVIFQTAYDQFAIKAFDENACDYLLKPFTDERLEQSLKKSGQFSEDKTANLDDVLNAAGKFLDRFVVSVGQRSKIIFEEEVICFISESHVTRVVLADIDYAYDQSLSYLEKNLNPERCIRLHRNSIVKLDEIASIDRDQNTSVVLRNGTELPVSRERKKKLMATLKD